MAVRELLCRFEDCLSLFHGTIEPRRCMNSWFTAREEALSSWGEGIVSEDNGEGGSAGVDVRYTQLEIAAVRSSHT